MGIEPTRGCVNNPSTALKAAGPTRRPDTPRFRYARSRSAASWHLPVVGAASAAATQRPTRGDEFIADPQLPCIPVGWRRATHPRLPSCQRFDDASSSLTRNRASTKTGGASRHRSPRPHKITASAQIVTKRPNHPLGSSPSYRIATVPLPDLPMVTTPLDQRGLEVCGPQSGAQSAAQRNDPTSATARSTILRGQRPSEETPSNPNPNHATLLPTRTRAKSNARLMAAGRASKRRRAPLPRPARAPTHHSSMSVYCPSWISIFRPASSK
jgi:hypothetical protein